MKITYKKRNGEIFTRIRNTYPPYRVGDITSMGWQVLDIKYRHKDKYYNYDEWSKLVDKEFNKQKRKREMIHNTKNFIKYVNQFVNFFIIFKLFIFISNKAILELFLLI